MSWSCFIQTEKLQKKVTSTVRLTTGRSLWHHVIWCCWPNLSMIEYTCHIQTSRKRLNYNCQSTLNSMLRPEFEGQNLWNIGSLNVDDWLLHYAYIHILIPRFTIFVQLLYEDIFMLWVIKNNIFINWPHQIMQHMLKCRDNNMTLLYTFVVCTNLTCLQYGLIPWDICALRLVKLFC